MALPRYPSLYQINTRVWLTELSRSLGRSATLDDIPDAELDRLAEQGFDWIWLLSVWQTGAAAQESIERNQTYVSSHAELRARAFPALAEICGSKASTLEPIIGKMEQSNTSI